MSIINALMNFHSELWRGRKGTVVSASIIIVATLLAFVPSVYNDFTNWDDDRLVLANPDIHGISVEHTRTVFSSFYLNHYVPLTMLSFMTEYALFGPNPFPFHVTNLLLHIFTALLVFQFIATLSGNRWVGLLTALLFTVHPLRVESVAWIAERKGLLCAVFYYLSLLLYIRYYRSGRMSWYVGSVLTLAAALLSKSMAISLPFVLLLLDYFFGRRITRKVLLEKVPFVLPAAVGGVLAVIGAHDAASYQAMMFHERLVASILALGFYAFKTVLPVNLCALYNGSGMLNGMSGPIAVSGMVILSAFVVFIVRSRIATRKKIFGLSFFLVTIFPVLQIFSSGGWTNLADRYTYISHVGLFYCIAEITVVLYHRSGTPVKRTLLPAGLVTILLSFTVLTLQRNFVWRNAITLWSDTINKCPGAVAYRNRGIAWKSDGSFDEALRDLNQAIELDSTNAFSYENRGELFLEQGNLEQALDDFTRAISLEPNHTSAYGNRGGIYLYLGDFRRALSDFQREISITPGSVQAYYNRGLAYSLNEDFERAIADYSRAITLDTTYARAYHNRGIVYGKQGDHARERSDLKKACDLGFERACDALMKNRTNAAENY